MELLRVWFDRNFLELGRELRLSYLPPLMVYLAAGISGLTGIVGTFFVKAREGGKIMNALYRGIIVSGVIAAIGFWFVTSAMMGE